MIDAPEKRSNGFSRSGRSHNERVPAFRDRLPAQFLRSRRLAECPEEPGAYKRMKCGEDRRSHTAQNTEREWEGQVAIARRIYYS